MKQDKSHWPHRHLTERVLNTLLLGGWVARLSYYLGGQGRLGVSRQEIVLEPGRSLPRPLKIAFASDFHAGPTTHPALFDDLLAKLKEEGPDLLLLGGDYVSFDAANIAALRAFLAGARVPLGTYAVLGNHDVWNGPGHIGAALEEAGVALLVNRNLSLPEPFGQVSICGIDDPWTGKPSVDAAFEGAGAVRIYLMHSPDGLWWLRGQRFDLALAGHTHGGQIVLQNGAPLKMPSGPYSRRYRHGRFEIPDNGPLVVSRGVGCSGIPLRLGADPELLVCTLR